MDFSQGFVGEQGSVGMQGRCVLSIDGHGYHTSQLLCLE